MHGYQFFSRARTHQIELKSNNINTLISRVMCVSINYRKSMELVSFFFCFPLKRHKIINNMWIGIYFLLSFLSIVFVTVNESMQYSFQSSKTCWTKEHILIDAFVRILFIPLIEIFWRLPGNRFNDGKLLRSLRRTYKFMQRWKKANEQANVKVHSFLCFGLFVYRVCVFFSSSLQFFLRKRKNEDIFDDSLYLNIDF